MTSFETSSRSGSFGSPILAQWFAGVAVLLVLSFTAGSGVGQASDRSECGGSGTVCIEGNGTLPISWYGYLLQQDGHQARARMNIEFVDQTPYFPSDLGCEMAGEAGSGYVASGWISVAGSDIHLFAVSAFCLSEDARHGEIVALDLSGKRLHLSGSLSSKTSGVMFANVSQDGTRFVLMEDRRPRQCP